MALRTNPIPRILLLVLMAGAASAATNVGGTIGSTTWTKAGGPYTATSTVTIPAGNTLTIQPGVDVLFSSVAELIVRGTLAATGTAADSIRFLPTTPSSGWKGIALYTGANATIHYARISGGIAIGVNGVFDAGGGGILVYNGNLDLDHSVVSGNKASVGGGVFVYGSKAVATMSWTAIRRNTATAPGITLGAGGGLATTLLGSATLDHCAIVDNTADDYAGGVYIPQKATVTLTNVTIAGNTANPTYGSGAIYAGKMQPASIAVKNSIIWGNTPQSLATGSGQAAIAWSDVQGGYSGTGNKNASPNFANAATGNYALTSGSPAIDAGDPNSPKDPDGTTADMGAYYLPQGSASYALSVSASGSGSVSKNPNAASYTPGTTVTLTATPASGWTFAGWSGDASGTQNPLAVSMTGSKTIVATFTSTSSTNYTLTVSITGSGVVTKSPDLATYGSGTAVQMTASPDPGWVFSGWSGGAGGTVNPLSVTMNGNKAISAVFLQETAVAGPIRLNSGGAATTAGGVSWSADAFYTGSTSVFANNSVTDIAGTTADAIYRTERYASANLGAFEYAVAVPPGMYTVRLHFAEIWFGVPKGGSTAGGPGSRVFDVFLEGAIVLDNYDIIADVGPATAVVKEFANRNVADGTLNIRFQGVVNKPKASAVEVIGTSTTTSYTLSVGTVGSGTVAKSPNAASYAPGTTVTLTATPATGWLFSGWSDAISGTANPQSVTMNGSKSVVASFAQPGGGQTIASLTLVNATTNADIGPLANGQTINLATIGTMKLNVRANTNPATVGSVKFGLDANPSFRIESSAPYALAGDISGDYIDWTPTVGSHTLTATPYTSSGASGTAGTPLTVAFTVTNVVARRAPEIPREVALGPNAPNPFNPATTIRFALPASSAVTLAVYGADGRHVRTLADGTFAAGVHAVDWDGRDGTGRPVASGVYLYRLAGDRRVLVRRMLLAR